MMSPASPGVLGIKSKCRFCKASSWRYLGHSRGGSRVTGEHAHVGAQSWWLLSGCRLKSSHWERLPSWLLEAYCPWGEREAGEAPRAAPKS